MKKGIKELGLAGIAILGVIGLATKLDMENNNYQKQTEVREITQEEKQNYSLCIASGLAVGVTLMYVISEISKDAQRRNYQAN